MLLSQTFIWSYATIYIFKKIFVFSYVYASVNTMFESLLSKLILTHTVSCLGRSHETAEK